MTNPPVQPKAAPVQPPVQPPPAQPKVEVPDFLKDAFPSETALTQQNQGYNQDYNNQNYDYNQGYDYNNNYYGSTDTYS